MLTSAASVPSRVRISCSTRNVLPSPQAKAHEANSLLEAHRPDSPGQEVALINPGGAQAFPAGVLGVLQQDGARHVPVHVGLIAAGRDPHGERLVPIGHGLVSRSPRALLLTVRAPVQRSTDGSSR